MRLRAEVTRTDVNQLLGQIEVETKRAAKTRVLRLPTDTCHRVE